MKTVEVLVRFNIQVPDNAKIEMIDIDGLKSGQMVFGVDFLTEDSVPVKYALNEYETLDVSVFE